MTTRELADDLADGIESAYPGQDIVVLPGTPRRAMVLFPPAAAQTARVLGLAGPAIDWGGASAALSRLAGQAVTVRDTIEGHLGDVSAVVGLEGT